ncbi:MFS transporter [Micromonospora matsumotoense]|uniref:MFS transporter n=1 Tax=Micromonospora matsumotoense TaxID=121616 RepID=UPI00342F714A
MCAATGFAILAAPGRQQTHTGRPLLERSLFGNRSFAAGLLFGALFFGAVTGLLYATTLYLQQRLGLPPSEAALMTAPVSVGIVVTSFSLRRHVVEHGRRVVTAGVVLFALGVVGMTVFIVTHPRPAGLIAAPLFLAGLGMGCCFGSIFAAALGDVTREQAGSASGVLNAIQQIVNAIGSATVATVYLATGGGLLPCLVLTLVATVACAASLPLLPSRGADLH